MKQLIYFLIIFSLNLSVLIAQKSGLCETKFNDYEILDSLGKSIGKYRLDSITIKQLVEMLKNGYQDDQLPDLIYDIPHLKYSFSIDQSIRIIVYPKEQVAFDYIHKSDENYKDLVKSLRISRVYIYRNRDCVASMLKIKYTYPGVWKVVLDQ